MDKEIIICIIGLGYVDTTKEDYIPLIKKASYF